MIKFEEAEKLIAENIQPIGVENKLIENSCGFVLAEDIYSKENHPLFNNSAVDGFAVILNDFENLDESNQIKLKIQGTIKAGDTSLKKIKSGSSFKIMTGAKVPENCNAIVMIEKCEIENDFVIIKKTPKINENIRFCGEEISIGEKIILKNTIITSATVALLASLGFSKIKVFKKPKISILTTGDELVDINKKLKLGKIRNSNRYFLNSALSEIGVQIVYQKHNIKDDRKLLYKSIKQAITKSDIVLITGGISIGDYDFVKPILEELKVKKIFWQIAVKPGKPTYFGKYKNKLIFGLPGNPVAVEVLFYELVYPIINSISGKNNKLIEKKGFITKEVSKKTSRLEFLRGVVEEKNGEYFVTPVSKQQSHMLSGFANANCLIKFPIEKNILNENEEVAFQYLPN